ncbi:MAG: ATP-binding cassette domain-containing protein [Candidatus Oceanisphaera merdipullorum]|nr:ATP-binding cassette domain-containing protein [Candidatus Oceanisphaera merdipullorum]
MSTSCSPSVSSASSLSPDPSQPLFRFQQHSLGYGGKTVLHELTLDIHQGERVALLGKSGSGKSTLLRQLRAQQAESVAWCPQQPGLVPMLSAFHNIYMGRLSSHSLLHNLANLVRPQAKPKAEIAKLAASLGLSEQLWQPAELLSGGQQSRVSLGRALYQQRPIFMGDEPVSALDERQADALLQLLGTRHHTLVVALHNLEQALSHCTRIIGLADGHVLLDAPAASLTSAELDTLYLNL